MKTKQLTCYKIYFKNNRGDRENRHIHKIQIMHGNERTRG